MSKCINSKTFEIMDDYFEVDDDIANSISLLNKKGYHTLFCCSGHLKDPRLYEKYHVEKKDFDGDILNDSYVVYEDDKYIDILEPYTFTSCYVMFDKDYHFFGLPDGFKLLNNNVIDRIIPFYENGIKRSYEDISKEIKEVNGILYNWVIKLKKIHKF